MAFKSTWTPPQRARDKPIPQEPPRLSGGFTYSASGGVAVAKSPANRLFDLRRLAKGEECTVRRFDGWCACQPETTVWGHTNSLSDRKGLGYKGNYAAGFFVGNDCHSAIDQGGLPQATVKALIEAAQARTRARLEEIAGNIALKPWRVNAARWALERLTGDTA